MNECHYAKLLVRSGIVAMTVDKMDKSKAACSVPVWPEGNEREGKARMGCRL